MLHTSLQDRTRSLPNCHLNLGDKNFTCQPSVNLILGGMLEEELQGFTQVIFSFLDRVALTGNIEFRTKGNKPIIFTLNDRR